MSLNIYLSFEGNCAEVFDYYKSIFGGEFVVKQTFGDGPPDMGVEDADKDKIMHVSLPVGESVLMGSDTAGGFGGAVTQGNNFSISYLAATTDEADRVFPLLSDGGDVKMALQETFWGSYFGMCTDKFGINWMINVDLNKK